MYGKLPPQAPEAEQAVLGAILLEREKLAEALEIIPTEDAFYQAANQMVYRAICKLYALGLPVDLLTVTEELRKAGELEASGGAYYLTQLTLGVVSSAHVETHARIVMEKFMRREIIRIGGQVTGNAYDDATDVFDLLEYNEAQLMEITSGAIQKQYVGAQALAVMGRESMVDKMTNPGKLEGITSGYKALDLMTGGWKKANLIIVAARPSVGKTAFVINLLLNAAEAGHGVGLFSMEMSVPELNNRIIASLSDVPLSGIQHGSLKHHEQEAFYSGCARLAGLNLHIDDTAALTMFELRTKARRMVYRDGVRLIAIDYLQLMQGDAKAGNREQEIAKISRQLKVLAKELDIPIIALSQMNRDNDKTGAAKNAKPQLSTLRESGAIEQDANIVMFLTRPDYQQSADETDPAVKDDATVHIAKNRDGAVDDLAMKFVRSVQRWFDLAGYDHYTRPFPDNPGAGISGRPYPPTPPAAPDDKPPF